MDREDIKTVIKTNLKNLCKAKNLTQAQLGEILDISGKSTISNYLNMDEPSVPDIMSLFRLKEHFGIPLDVLFSPSFDPQSSFEVEGVHIAEYDKFLGIYSLYYLTSNKISPISNEYNTPSLSYGVLAIVKDNGDGLSTSNEAYRAYGCFSLKSNKDAEELKTAAEKIFSAKDNNGVRNIFAARNRFSEGNFEIIQKGKFYSVILTGYSKQPADERRITTDKISLLGFNPDQTNPTDYIGGAMLSSSFSRGMSKYPCSQVVLASRQTLFAEDQEILNRLQRHNKFFSMETVAEDILSRTNKLYSLDYTPEDRDILLKNYIKTSIDRELNCSTSQLYYILESEDQLLYRFLKDTQSGK